MKWCRHCDRCASRRGPQQNTQAPMQYVVGAPLERMNLDCYQRQNLETSTLLIVQDYFTKWVEAYAIPNQEAVTVASSCQRIHISIRGTPVTSFRPLSKLLVCCFYEMCSTQHGENSNNSTASAIRRRFNRTIEAQLLMTHRDWDCHVPVLLMAYCAAVHESTKCTPAMMTMGRDLRLPVDLLIGRPSEEPTPLAADYADNLQRRLEQVHEFVRPQLKLISNHTKEI